MISTVIFDLFGTLVHLTRDSKPYLTLAKRCSEMGYREAIQRSLINDCESLAEYVQLIGLKPQSDIHCLETELQHDIENIALFEDTLSVLQKLKENKVKTVLVSNLATPYKQAIINHGLDSLFDHLVYSCDCGFAKPDERVYQHALDKVQSTANQTIMVGDSYKSDVQGPSQIGIKGFHLDRKKGNNVNSNTINTLNQLLLKMI